MSKKQKEYKRLPGKGKSFVIGHSTLWLGKDHLLSIDSRRLSEDYKRFYYADIQSVITRKTAVGKIQNLFLALFFGFFTLLCMFTPEVWSIFFGVLAALLLLPLLIALLTSLLRGPTCICHLQTAVQTEKLPSLNRLKTCRKAMSLLMPLIEQAQGRLTPEQSKADTSVLPHAEAAASGVNPALQTQRDEHGGFHEILFYLLLFYCLLTCMDLFYNHVAITLLGTVIGMGIGVFVIIALVRQYGSNMKSAVRGLTWGTLVYMVFSFLLGYIHYISIVVNNPEVINNQWALIKIFSSQSPWNSPWLTGLYSFSIVCSFTVGLSGLILLRKSCRLDRLSHAVPTTFATRQVPLGQE
jgi:hypothetical protein